MPNELQITIIILCSIIIIGLIVLAFLLIKMMLNQKKDNMNNTPNIDLKEIGSLSNQINNLSSSLEKDIKLSLSEGMNKLLDKTNVHNEANNNKLDTFQRNISESINLRFDALNKQMDSKLEAINKKVDEKLAEGFKGTGETLAQVRERLQIIDAAQRNIEDLSKDVVSLKNVLEGNQSRGQYGEYQLSMVLHNVFGDTVGCYEEQYTLKKVKDGDDVRADAVVFVPEPNKLICIDSKFPFQSYSKIFETNNEEEKAQLKKAFASDVKKHITVIKDKYIVEGKTAGYAMMFIPNDGVFAFIHHELNEVVEYSREKNVILTSPSTLSPMLVTINMVKIEAERAKNVKVISKHLQSLGKQFDMFSKEWSTFSRQLATLGGTKDKLDNRVTTISGRFVSISNNSSLVEEIETPLIEEEID